MDIMISTTRLVSNNVSYRLKFEKINDFFTRIEMLEKNLKMIILKNDRK
jgi:hypothetical protein